MEKARIGVNEFTYNWHRNITRHNHDGFEFVKVIDRCKIVDRVLSRLGRRSGYFQHMHGKPYWPSVAMFHLWRTVSAVQVPWVVTTSTGLPFGYPIERSRPAMELLAGKFCKRIIVNSNNAFQWQLRKAQVFPDLEQSILQKMIVLHPPQDALFNAISDKRPIGATLKCAFVGHQFFSKGGLHLLRTVRRLVAEGAKIELQIVSKLKLDSSSGAGAAELAEANDIIQSCAAVRHHMQLANNDVLDLLRDCDIALLPSYFEAYGYLVLEAQAAGCATVTTDVFALPEINPTSVGWQIKIAENSLNYATEAERVKLGRFIEEQLYKNLSEALADPSGVRIKGQNAFHRIVDQHCPVKHAQSLLRIYAAALQGE